MISHRADRARTGRHRSRIGAGLLAARHGLALTGQMIAETGLILIVTAVAILAAIGVGLPLVPGALRTVRRSCDRTRGFAGAWCGTPIPAPYLPPPDGGERPGFWRPLWWQLRDQATWRDLLWLLADPCAGWVLTLLPASLVAYGLFGMIEPAVWQPIAQAGADQWYAFIHVTSPLAAWLCPPLGAVFLAVGLLTGPPALRRYGALAAWLLGPTSRAGLAQRVGHLTRTRGDALSAQASEIGRIERDLHDGAQARLVAMGMTLDAAARLLDSDPAAAGHLLAEARSASAQALAELRALIRGIHPPVLADRGLADAVRALALDSPLPVEVSADLPGRPELPVESAAYFAVSELLANVARHARAGGARVELRDDNGALRITVGDDGRGGARPAPGSGLAGIERRLAAFDGTLAVSSPAGGPTQITMEIPCAWSSPKTSSC